MAPDSSSWAPVSRDAVLTRMLSANHLLNGEWIPDILLALSAGPLRYTELLESIRSSPVVDARTHRGRYVQPRILLNTLRRMEDDGLVLRREEAAGLDRSVSYELTPAAQELLGALMSTVTWCERHKELIAEAEHRASDRRSSS
jgi:DNA-binding HxlR family transcriptional regulator